jgi:pimeloyl-ACP methyl ester carboxylesterase
LGQDVIALISALGDGKAVVVGHDWGALAAYAAAVIAPDRIEKLIALAIPYGRGLISALIGDRAQQRRSWYMFFFLTALAEPAVAHDDFALIDQLWREWSPGWSPAADDLRAVKGMFRQPGVIKAALSYYRFTFLLNLQRAGLADLQARIGHEPIRVPTLYLGGSAVRCTVRSR